MKLDRPRRDAEPAGVSGQGGDNQAHPQRAAGGDRHDQRRRARSRLPHGGVLRHLPPVPSRPFDVATSTDARALPTPPGERRWGLAGTLVSVTLVGLSIGQSAPLLPLLLEARGTNVTLNGLNAGAAFVGVIVGPLLAPRYVRRLGIRNFMLVCFGIDIVLTLALKAFDSIAAWFVLRALLGLVGSSVFTTGEAWINLLAGDKGRGRIIGLYAAALSGGFGTGPLVLSLTGIRAGRRSSPSPRHRGGRAAAARAGCG